MAEGPNRPFVFRPPAPPSKPFGTLGTVALVVGFGVLGAYMLDLHGHTCEACGTRWRHLGAFNLGDPVTHTCRQCGTVQWWKDGVPHVFRDALRTAPPNPWTARMRQLSQAAESAPVPAFEIVKPDPVKPDQPVLTAGAFENKGRIR